MLNVAATSPSTTFALHDVLPASDLLATVKPQESLSGLLKRNPARVSEQPPIEACCDYSTDCVERVDTHPLIAATDLAYSGHRPLILSPDMIWVTILQGLAQHVFNNPEQHRSKLVSHSGKQAMSIRIPKLVEGSPENLWDKIIAQFSEEMQRRLGSSYARFISDFTTTGPLELTACQVALMDLYAPYFDYQMMGVCGIPQITLEGEVRDWKNLRKKIETLRDFDLDWWLAELRPIFDHFVRAAEGDVDRTFWQNIHKNETQYGATRINGWMVRLIPYVENSGTGQYTVRNPIFNDPEAELTTSMLPSGISSVQLLYEELDESAKEACPKSCYELLGGFIGVAQIASSKALRPKLGWAIRRGGVASRWQQMLAVYNPTPPLGDSAFAEAARDVLGVLVNKYNGGLSRISAEMRHFYGICNGVTIGADQDRLVIRSFESCDVFKNPPLYDPAQPAGPAEAHNATQGYDWWLRFGDFADGSFVAIRLQSTYAGGGGDYWFVLHGGRIAEIQGRVPIVATSLNQFLLQVLTSGGRPTSFTPLSPTPEY